MWACNLLAHIGLTILLLINLMQFVTAAEPNKPAQGSNIDMIIKAQQYYGAGKIEDAEHLALKLISDDNDLTKHEKYSAYRLLAFCAIAADNLETGKKHFISAMHYNPNMTADPLTWSPKLRTVFVLAVAEVDRGKKLEREWIYASEAQIGRRASLKSLYLPGAGQLMKKQKRKGITLGVLSYAAISGYLIGQIYLPTARDKYQQASTPRQADARWKDYRNARYMVSITGLAALAIYGYTFFDALWSAPAVEAVKLPNSNQEP